MKYILWYYIILYNIKYININNLIFLYKFDINFIKQHKIL
jgi:hypothetical protein